MKKTKTVVITIILGALGSACWEWALKPAFVIIYNRIILYSLHLFSDSFYSKVANNIDAPASLTYAYFLLSIAVLILIPPKFFENLLHGTPEDKADATFKSVLRLLSFIIITFNMFTTSIANQTARGLLKNIEIVAPYVTDIEYKTLKSDFYRMDSKADYLDLISQIEAIMNENGLGE